MLDQVSGINVMNTPTKLASPALQTRRSLLVAGAGTAAAMGLTALTHAAAASETHRSVAKSSVKPRASRLVTQDGTSIYFKDWGSGTPVVFCHGYPLSSDAWENQMLFLSERGYRVIAHDRRGFGRSDQPGHGYDYDTFADDLASLIESLDLKDASLIGHSMGGGEVARYIGRHGQKRIAKVAFVGAVTPFLLKTSSNVNGVPKEVFDGFRAAVRSDRSQWNKDVSMPYFSYNRPRSKPSEGVREDYWRQSMMTSMVASYDAIGAFSETDFREDLATITVPALVVHGTDDQIVPIEISGDLTAKIIKHARMLRYDGAPHGLQITHKDQLNADLLNFLRA
jgi:non-heme chloroperoxidase